jgi:tetratricopeptide (TPR) repeat protein
MGGNNMNPKEQIRDFEGLTKAVKSVLSEMIVQQAKKPAQVALRYGMQQDMFLPKEIKVLQEEINDLPDDYQNKELVAGHFYYLAEEIRERNAGNAYVFFAQQAKETDPDNVDIWIYYAFCLERAKDLDRAQKLADDAFQKDPKHNQIYNLLGKIALSKGEVLTGEEQKEKFAEAEKHFRRALSRSSREEFNAREKEEQAKTVFDYEEQSDQFWKGLGAEFVRDDALRGLAQTLEKAGKDTEAEEAYRKAMLSGNDSDAMYAYSQFLTSRQRKDEAEEILRELTTEHLPSFPAYEDLWKLYREKGDVENCRALAVRATQIAGNMKWPQQIKLWQARSLPGNPYELHFS